MRQRIVTRRARRGAPAALAGAAALCLGLGTMAPAAPIFENSVVSNDLAFITDGDPNAFACLVALGRDRREMPDKRGGDLFADRVHVLDARFTDGTRVGIWVHPALDEDRARHYAMTVAQRLGHLPTMMRALLDHVVIHDGDETAFAEDQGRFFVLYSGNIDTRIGDHDLEETVFHESVHATLDADHAQSAAWRRAQQADGDFVTDYAARNPDGEDMAESALFAFTLLTHPGRLPAETEAELRRIMPNRLAFFADLFPPRAALFVPSGPAPDCP